MPNEQNLIPNSERTPSELREMTSKGGKSDVVSSIVIQREHLLAEIRSLQDEIQEVRKYISRCEPYFQNPIYQHYINGKTWISIAKNYNTTADSLRIACHRYVRQHPTFGEYAD